MTIVGSQGHTEGDGHLDVAVVHFMLLFLIQTLLNYFPVMPSRDIPQQRLSITCGGGSGIVQNTEMLVLKSEHAKLERKVSQLQKEHEMVLK